MAPPWAGLANLRHDSWRIVSNTFKNDYRSMCVCMCVQLCTPEVTDTLNFNTDRVRVLYIHWYTIRIDRPGAPGECVYISKWTAGEDTEHILTQIVCRSRSTQKKHKSHRRWKNSKAFLIAWQHQISLLEHASIDKSPMNPSSYGALCDLVSDVNVWQTTTLVFLPRLPFICALFVCQDYIMNSQVAKYA